jgi:poly-gamma-glutamate capsule biosynthesis protein CapA/YwtB (metallophosphatase superfamily)
MIGNKKLKIKNKTNQGKRFAIAGLIIALLALSTGLLLSKKDQSNPSSESSKPQAGQVEEELAVSKDVIFDLAAVGDMLPHETVTQSAKTAGGYDYLSLISSELKQSFNKSELRFCNQEAPSAASLGVKGYPAFNAPAQFPKDLSAFGCNMISTGNNHTNDGGQTGVSGTLDEWDAIKPKAVAGSNRSAAEQSSLRIFEHKGVKVGFTAFALDSNSGSANSYSLNMLGNTALLSQQISELRAQADLVVVSVHWGVEDSHTLSGSQKSYAKKIADLGADVIIGTGPHVWQPYEEIISATGKTTHVWYSIGNALNSQTKVDQLFSGVALLKVSKTEAGVTTIDSPRVLPTYMHYTWSKGVGMSNGALLGRVDLKWGTVSESSSLIPTRNDFKTTAEAQREKLRGYLANQKVEVLTSY